MATLESQDVLYYAKFAFFALIIRCIVVYIYRATLHPLNGYPGPTLAKVTDWYGAWYALRTKGHIMAHNNLLKHGSVIRVGPNKLVFNTARALRDIYLGDRFYKAPTYVRSQFDASSWHTLSTPDKRAHRERRKLISHGLSERSIRKLEPSMNKRIDEFVKLVIESPDDEIPNMAQRCKRLGLDVIGELAFGADLKMQSSIEKRWVITGMKGMFVRVGVYFFYPLAGELMFWIMYPLIRYGRWKYFNMLEELVKNRLAMGHHAKQDLLSFLIDYKDPETGAKLTLKEIWNEGTLLFPAGGDTTSTTMAALFFYLARNPTVYSRLAAEIRSTFPPGTPICSGPALPSCTYLRACIDEALRMSPPVSTVLWRVLSPQDRAPVVIDGHVVPPGTTVGVSIYSLHHNPDIFPDPSTFNPSRWLVEPGDSEEDKAIKKTMREAFAPFSIGSRACAGKVMAYTEASVVFAKTLAYSDFEEIGERKIGGVYEINEHFVTSCDGPYLRFTRRESIDESVSMEKVL
ncbi:cytochrome P450 [Corynespora cassiicola Philippines]|uniref:Cytochrome P450 n=1 Tax=Corynespora cassiicola Philippines TaxID=1448308 RepID=A0A2T2NNN4_CORCC|nr:cytochrome P450 [Corynespora cassiicola Philippines]